MINFKENSCWRNASEAGDFNSYFGAGIVDNNDQAYWQACGILVAMMAYHVGVIPNVSPWVTLATVAGTQLPKIGLSGIRALDPSSPRILEPWFQIKPTPNVTEQHTQKLLHVFTAAGTQVCNFFYSGLTSAVNPIILDCEGEGCLNSRKAFGVYFVAYL